ncbi:sodium:calcium antiporter [Aromatoleum sp.]|uniref:sodium:calcium antiporter n=1 Tax=Aromatoleum sp. TaxID=2307007 RepID=UPI002FC62CE6
MLENLSVWGNVGVFALGAAIVWAAGTRVARYADAIQRRTGMGEAVAGMLLLGLITALPEVAVTVTASHSGDATLAVNNILGGLALNVAILASADAAIRREALTATVASALPLLQGALLVLMLSIAAAATVAGDRQIFGVGIWSWLLLGIYGLSVELVRKTRGHEAWVPTKGKALAGATSAAQRGDSAKTGERNERARSERDRSGSPLPALIGKTALGAGAILAAGYAIARSGEALAEQTGLGASFFGAVFLAVSTSLPEITIVFSSVRLGRYAMAVSDILGANLVGLTLLFVADAAYRGGPVLAQVDRFGTFAALLAIAVTALFIAGLLERRHAMVLRMGVDSLAVIGTYLAGVVVLYRLK